MSTIAVLGASKAYRTAQNQRIDALREVDLEVGDGEFLTVLGPSGCGKSTLLHLIAGLLRPSTGRVLLDGEEVRGPDPKIGIVFQRPVLFRWRTVLENVMLPAEVLGIDRTKYTARAEELLRLAGLTGFENRMPYELSGGMQQRAALCRTLAFNPQVLLMDEPFGALDALTREELGLQLLEIWERDRKTVVFVTHSIPEAILLGDRVVVMTPRPGAVAEIVSINLPRPRGVDVEYSPEFAELSRQLRDLIHPTSTVTVGNG